MKILEIFFFYWWAECSLKQSGKVIMNPKVIGWYK